MAAPREECLFCPLVREGTHVNAADGFVAIDDITPQAPVHILVLPERHVDTFRDVAEFDDGVLRAMGRRYSVATYLRRLAPLQEEFNLTSDVIVGFPAEDEGAFATTLQTIERAGITKVHVFPYSPRPGTLTAGDDRVPPQEKKTRGARLRALSHELCLARWREKTEDVVLVDRPGRGYGDDYTPWLVDAPVGELVRVRAGRVTKEGIRARAA